MATVTPSPRLLGREQDLAAIADTVRAVGAGEGSLLVVEGPAGIGKTALVAEARRAARAAGLRVLSARGGELEQAFAFGVVRQLFEPALAGAREDERGAWLAGAAALAAPVFEPAGAGFTVGDPGFQRRHGLYWLAANMSADGGLMLLVDDIHWADAVSIEFLGFLARRVEELPIGLMVAGRPRPDGFGGLAVDPAARVLRPAPLNPDAIGALIASELHEAADPSFVDACLSASGGVPFLLRELLREVAAEHIAPRAQHSARVAALSPRNITTSVMLRLARRPPAASALAKSVAVLGDDAPITVAAELAGIGEDDARSASQILIDADVLAPDEPLRFVHPIVRTAIYEGMPAAERPRAHARAAVSLHAHGAPDETVAAQLRLSAPVGESWAVPVLRHAAARAMSVGAPDVAAGHFERALAEVDNDTDRERVLVELGTAEADAGSPDAVKHLVQASELARSPQRRAEIAVERSRLLRFLGRGIEALDVVDAAEAELGDAEVELKEQLELERLATATMSTAALRRLGPLRERLRDSGGAPSSDADRFRLGLMALDRAQCGASVKTVVELAQRAVSGRPPGLGVTPTGGYAVGMAAIALNLADQYESALALTTGLLDFYERVGVMAGAASMLAQRSYIYYRTGALADAEADAIRALELGREVRSAPAQHSRAGGTLTFVAVERGEMPHPELMLAATATESTATRSLAYSRAEHLLAQAQFAAAATALLAIGQLECELGWEGPAQYPWRSQAALALAQVGDIGRARELADDELRRAREYGAPRPLGVALRAMGRLGEPQDRLERLSEAVSLLASSGAALEHARALVELGTALRVAGQRRAAREQLQAGYDVATQCTSTRLADHAWQELLAAGARPRRKELKGIAALTPSERRIAELAASGATNREIAQTLFVTAKTVETHLGHAFTKLEVASRTDLADVLATTG